MKHKQHDKRRNLHMTTLVRISGKIADRGFSKEAAQVCVDNDVPFDVALRVITQPKKRRTVIR